METRGGRRRVEEERLLRITTCLANSGFNKEVGIMVQLNRTFWGDEQIWDAYKDVKGGGVRGRTRLMYAAKHGKLMRVIFYLDRGARVNIATNGVTALMMASEKGHLEVVRHLCERGANVNAARTNGGATALMEASWDGNIEVVRELCERGASVNAARTDNGATALMMASEKGHLEVVHHLCERGARVNV